MIPSQSEDISNREAVQIFGRALRYVRPFRGRFAGKIGLAALSLMPSVLLPWPVKLVVDHVILEVPLGEPTTPHPPVIRTLLQPLADASPLEILFWMALVQGALIVLIGAFGTAGAERDRTGGSLASGRDDATQTENDANYGFSYAGGLFGLFDYRYTIRLTQMLNHHYRSRLFERIQRLPMASFDDERIGDAVYRVMYDTPSITGLSYRLIVTPIVSVMQLLLTIWFIRVTFSEHPQIWIAAALFLPLTVLVTFPFGNVLRRRGMRSRSAGSTTTTTVEEGMSNILAVQSLGGGERERSRFDRDSWNSFGRYRDLLIVVIGVSLAGFGLNVAVGWYVFVTVTDLVITGQLSPGDFSLLFTYYLQIAGHASRIGRLWIDMQRSAAGLNRVFFLMDLPSEEDPAGARPLPRIRRGVHLETVDFTYPDGTAALRDIDLDVPVGQVTALCGPAGAGKTTLAYLIPRFLSPTRGRLLADGVDLQSVTRDSVRSQVSFVFQETALFDATVAENIRTANPDASETEIRRAAHIAGADEFIRRLPEGYNTRLGRAGGKLSVGQKQRLSIARGLVRNSAILILDEPTSALDPETEHRLVAALREASRDRAVVVIAHRLSTIRGADQIVFLDEGRIIERGSHDELMAHPDGTYRRFVDLQTRGAA